MGDKTRGADKTTTMLTTRCSTAHTKHFEGKENIFGLLCVVIYDMNHTYMYTCWSKFEHFTSNNAFQHRDEMPMLYV